MGAQIRAARSQRGLSLRELAKRTGGEVTSAALSRIEKGDRYPTLRTLEALARALNGAFTVTPDGTVLRLAL